ncbi:uncharacterized protein SOCE26_079850 [Sorangium cellulosum]|uniref:Uncharacterized protein n=1 Tax=Sorangium cellulosum TaxID=56 RepID=A0A2L0F4W6_SORCE|nr:hypothetical protein [Sorangium cellulosum]AUX46479.1 uncharacterized protein SOCE26_079850 [Sorangium cellulosum]
MMSSSSSDDLPFSPQLSASPARFLGFGLAAGLAALVAPIVAGVLWSAVGQKLPLASLVAGVLVATVAAVCRRAASAGVPLAGSAAALASLAVAPLLWLLSARTLDDWIVPVPGSTFHGMGGAPMALAAPVAFLLSGMLGWWVALFFAWGRPVVAAAVRWLSLGALTLSAALLAWSTARAVVYPLPEGYVASLPVAATVPRVAGAPVSELPPELVPGRRAEVTKVYRDPVEGLGFDVERRCDGPACTFALIRPAAQTAPWDHGRFKDRSGVGRSGPIVVKRDEAHDLWVAVGADVVAFRGATLAPGGVRVHAVRDRLSPPHGVMVGAGCGVLLAALLLRRRRRAAAQLGRVAAGAPGALGDDGWITFDGGEPAVRAATELRLDPGPVLVLGQASAAAPRGASPGASGGVYRGEAPAPLGPDEVIPGEKAALLAAGHGELTALDALVLAAAVLTAAPLAAAAWQLLVG